MSEIVQRYKIYLAAIKLSYTKFTYDNLMQMATTLTFYTLTAVVPVMAVALGIAQGFGLDDFLKQQLSVEIAGQKQIMQTIFAYAQNLLANLRVDIISSVGLLILFFTAFKVLSNIEDAFNKIWQVSATRNLSFRFSRYMALCLIAPAILIVNNLIQLYTYKYLKLFHIDLWLPAKILTTSIVALFIIWLYIFMPNYRLRLKNAAIAGMAASILLQITHTLFFYFQLRLLNYGAVYGGLAALPILLIWLQATWFILLFGAELCFLLQHRVTKVWEFNTNLLCWEDKLQILTDITNIFIEKDKHNLGATDIKEIADKLKISTCCIQEMINNLVSNQVLYKISSSSFYNKYILAANIKNQDLSKLFSNMAFNI